MLATIYHIFNSCICTYVVLCALTCIISLNQYVARAGWGSANRWVDDLHGKVDKTPIYSKLSLVRTDSLGLNATLDR